MLSSFSLYIGNELSSASSWKYSELDYHGGICKFKVMCVASLEFEEDIL